MLSSLFKSKKILGLFTPFFIIFSIIILYFGNLKLFIIYSVSVMLHEMAHYYVSKKLGYRLNKLYLMPYGICLNYKDNVFAGNDEVYIAIAGPLINYFMCILCVALWWLFPETYYYLDYFSFCNLTLATFNLIPCFPLDGGRVFISLLSRKFDREKVYKIAVLINYFVSFCLVFLFVVSIFNQINYSYIMLAIFLFSGCINPNKHSNYNYLSLGINREAVIKNGSNVKIFASSSKTPIFKIMSKFSKFKYNIVYIIYDNGQTKALSETTLQKLAIKYSPALSISDIIETS